MIERIISGGQTGASEGAMRAAIRKGIKTGGWMPKGFRTDSGNRKRFAQECGMSEHSSSDYAGRTVANVEDSDGTLLFVWGDRTPPDEKLTRMECENTRKPLFIVELSRHADSKEKWNAINADASSVLNWIISKKIRTLNIAGPRELRARGVCAFAYGFIMEILNLDSEVQCG